MSAKKPTWTAPGPIEPGASNTVEARKGTAAANPVLSLSADASPGTRRTAGTDGSAGGQGAADHRSPAEIEAEIEQTRDRLAGTLDELTERLSPRAALRRANATAREAFTGPDGGVRKDRAAMVGGVLLAAVGGVVALQMVRRR
jgi:hypothetical protein